MASVLIVDDEAAIRATVRAGLEDAGYTVIEAGSGAQALDTLRATSDSLVVLVDLRMPDVSGFELLRQVELDPALTERHAYIVLSADEQSLPVVRAMRSAIVLTGIAKPFDLDTLLATVAQAATTRAGMPRAGGKPSGGPQG
jgi:two-component system chemotaxis response regulator CheY